HHCFAAVYLNARASIGPLAFGRRTRRSSAAGRGRQRRRRLRSAGTLRYPCCSREDVAMRKDRFIPTSGCSGDQRDPDLDAFLRPAQAFEHPMKVVTDPDLTVAEKRAILTAWASDACAVEAEPALRQAPGSPRQVEFDDVMDTLRTLDRQGERP